MSEEPHEEQVEDQHPVPLTQTFGYGAGTFLTVGVIDLLAHWGPTGLVIGGIAAYVVARHGPELTSQVREALPSPPPGQPEIEEPRRMTPLSSPRGAARTRRLAWRSPWHHNSAQTWISSCARASSPVAARVAAKRACWHESSNRSCTSPSRLIRRGAASPASSSTRKVTCCPCWRCYPTGALPTSSTGTAPPRSSSNGCR